MACKIGVDNKYRPQPAPCRWGKTYRCERRNSMKSVWSKRVIGFNHTIRVKVMDRCIWGEAYYSDRHLVRYRASKRLQQERITRAASM